MPLYLIASVLLFITFFRVFTVMFLKGTWSRVDNIAAILGLQFIAQATQFPMKKILYFYVSSLRIMCAVSSVAVPCNRALPECCASTFRTILRMFQLPHFIADTTFDFTFHMRCTSTVRSLSLLSSERCLLSQMFCSWHSSWTNSDPYRSGCTFQITVLSLLRVMFQA